MQKLMNTQTTGKLCRWCWSCVHVCACKEKKERITNHSTTLVCLSRSAAASIAPSTSSLNLHTRPSRTFILPSQSCTPSLSPHTLPSHTQPSLNIITLYIRTQATPHSSPGTTSPPTTPPSPPLPSPYLATLHPQ